MYRGRNRLKNINKANAMHRLHKNHPSEDIEKKKSHAPSLCQSIYICPLEPRRRLCPLYLPALYFHNLRRRAPQSRLQHNRLTGAEQRTAHDSAGELMPAIGRLQDVLVHGASEAIAVVSRRGDCGFVLAAVFDPRFEFLVPGVGTDAVCCYQCLFRKGTGVYRAYL